MRRRWRGSGWRGCGSILPGEKEIEAVVEALLQKWHQERGERRHLFIGIGGGSASGKSTLAKRLIEKLAPLAVEVIGQDRFFKPTDELPIHHSETCREPWPDYNRPDSFRTEEMFQYCRSVDGTDVVILEGILVLYYEELRALMDLKCYVAADADERIVRRIQRNMKELGDYDFITSYYLDSVRFQHARFNAPTQRYADLAIPGGMAERAEREMIVEVLCRGVRRQFDRDG